MTQKTSTGKPFKGLIHDAFFLNTPKGRLCLGRFGEKKTISTSPVISEYVEDDKYYIETKNSRYEVILSEE